MLIFKLIRFYIVCKKVTDSNHLLLLQQNYISSSLVVEWVAVKFGINMYHKYWIGNVDKFHEAKLSEICQF